MNTAPVDQHTSPLDADQAQSLNALIENLSANQVTWISGYLAGVAAHSAQGAVAAVASSQPAPAPAEAEPLTVLYGSQTGNAEDVAEQFAARARAAGLNAQAQDMLDYKPRSLKNEKNLLVLASTHGEGDPPDNAEDLHQFLFSKKAPTLDGLRFAVLAFGDTSYDNFCQTGKDFDRQLEALGGARVIERVDLDVDFDEPAESWAAEAVEAFQAVLGEPEPAANAHPTVTPMPGASARATTTLVPSRKQPYAAEVLDNVTLNGRGAAKDVHHIELDAADSGLAWAPGDSLGVAPRNDPAVVAELIAALGLVGDEAVTGVDGQTTLTHALGQQYEITTLTRPLVEAYARHAESAELDALLANDDRAAFAEYTHGRQLVDLVEDYPAGIGAGDFVRLLRKIPPRLYSIASSCAANPDEIHLTVDALRYQAHGRSRAGVASTELADRSEDAKPRVYVDANKNFKLPADDVPIIMVGPGTGVAPFRAFVEEREERGATGDNWLFFGTPHFRTDFYYQTDWLRWRREGVLTRMDTAFSRDQADKVYVQDRLRERGADVWAWLERGAVVYVCGDAEAMAPDVHAALIDVIAEHGGMDADAAADYLKRLQKDKRYQRDVY